MTLKKFSIISLAELFVATFGIAVAGASIPTLWPVAVLAIVIGVGNAYLLSLAD
jgi:hypothetical protein